MTKKRKENLRYSCCRVYLKNFLRNENGYASLVSRDKNLVSCRAIRWKLLGKAIAL